MVRAARFDSDGGVAGGRGAGGQQIVQATGGQGQPPFVIERVSSNKLLEKCLMC